MASRKRKVSTADKADVCVNTMARFVLKADSSEDLSKWVRGQLGLGWTLTSAIQWLSGKTAREYIEERRESDLVGGVPKSAALVLLGIATDITLQLGQQAPTEDELSRIQSVAAARAIDLS